MAVPWGEEEEEETPRTGVMDSVTRLFVLQADGEWERARDDDATTIRLCMLLKELALDHHLAAKQIQQCVHSAAIKVRLGAHATAGTTRSAA